MTWSLSSDDYRFERIMSMQEREIGCEAGYYSLRYSHFAAPRCHGAAVKACPGPEPLSVCGYADTVLDDSS
jgi:hypothetical protein